MSGQDILREKIDAMIALLRNFPANGQVTDAGDGVAVNAILYRFIELREVTTPCPTCGAERVGHNYFRITPAGRAILALADRPTPIGEGN